jgi:hypothetical protein
MNKDRKFSDWYASVGFFLRFDHNRSAPVPEGAILNLGVMGEAKRGSIEAMFLAAYTPQAAASLLAKHLEG